MRKKRLFRGILTFILSLSLALCGGVSAYAYTYTDVCEEIKILSLPYKTEYVEDAGAEEGATAVLTRGICGSIMMRTEITRENGEITNTYQRKITLSNAVNEVISIGTKKTFGLPYIDYAHGGTDYAVTQYYGGASGHIGIDFAVYYGNPIVSVMSGKVVEARNVGELLKNGSNARWTYGTYVVIDHGNGFMTYYAHMSRKIVSVGDTVKKGQTVGYSGNTGRVSPAPTNANPLAGTHLHFEIRKYNETLGVYRTVDPTLYLPRWVN